MAFDGLKIGFALTGSFCTLSKVLTELEKLKEQNADIVPIMSEIVWSTDTRFGKAEDFKSKITQITGKEIIHSIKGAEPIGPKNLLDALVIAPCTGNTISKMANGITDSCVSMAAKATLRNGCPVIVAISTNDGLSGSARNIGTLLNKANIFFVPFGQDDSKGKPDSLVADMTKIDKTLSLALQGKKLQPQIIMR
ncbi:MAG: dipicolinate synthase subunit B [Clostridia bacterium]|nr:dipicolinate synthase subunit B [Clostridia bacterium]